MKNWKHYELKTKQIVSKVDKDKKVFHNVGIVGKLSKVKRQIDVQLVNPNQFDFIAIECKDHKRKIGVETIEAFASKLQDVGAKRGAVVSNSPFSKPAVNMATSLGIDLLTLVDTGDSSIRTKLFAGMFIKDTFVKSLRVRIKFSSSLPIYFKDEKIQFVLANGKIIAAYEIFQKLWNETGDLRDKEGLWAYTPPYPNKKRVRGPKGPVPIDDVKFIYEVKTKVFFGKIKIINAEGIYDVKKQKFTCTSRSFTTEKIVPYKLEKIWKEVNSIEEVKGKYTFGLEVKSLLPKKLKKKIL